MVVGVGVVFGGPTGMLVASWAATNAAVAVQTAGAAVGAASAIASGAAAGAVTGASTVTIASVGAGLASGGLQAAALSAAGAVGAQAAAGGVAAIASGAAATAAAEGAIVASLMAGPVGWAIVGASDYTWDCWKPIVMEKSVEPSLGIRLQQLYNHPNLREMTLDGTDFIAENVRGERFRLSPVTISGVIAFHSSPL